MARDEQEFDNLSGRLDALYWESERSVNQITEDLGISKGTLYEMVKPRNAGHDCPACGDGMVYPNRTARDRGQMECPTCGAEREAGASERAAGALTAGGEAGRKGGGRSFLGGASGEEALVRVVAGTALLAVAAGLLLGRVFRRR